MGPLRWTLPSMLVVCHQGWDLGLTSVLHEGPISTDATFAKLLPRAVEAACAALIA